MPLDMGQIEIEAMMWKPTGELRWRRPKGCDDNEKVLEQLFERVTGERRWQTIPTLLDD